MTKGFCISSCEAFMKHRNTRKNSGCYKHSGENYSETVSTVWFDTIGLEFSRIINLAQKEKAVCFEDDAVLLTQTAQTAHKFLMEKNQATIKTNLFSESSEQFSGQIWRSSVEKVWGLMGI